MAKVISLEKYKRSIERPKIKSGLSRGFIDWFFSEMRKPGPKPMSFYEEVLNRINSGRDSDLQR